MLPALYSTPWYNEKKFKEKNFFSNKKSFIVSLPRLRQIRVKPGKLAVDCDSRLLTFIWVTLLVRRWVGVERRGVFP